MIRVFQNSGKQNQKFAIGKNGSTEIRTRVAGFKVQSATITP
jgi:hypothetical protein